MMNNPHPIRDYLVPGKRVHLVGIGGVSMCPLAEVLRGMGLTVQGSDMAESDTPTVVGHYVLSAPYAGEGMHWISEIESR